MTDPTRPPLRLDLAGHRMTRCQSDDDGYCVFSECPQLRDNEPHATGRHCPLDIPPADVAGAGGADGEGGK